MPGVFVKLAYDLLKKGRGEGKGMLMPCLTEVKVTEEGLGIVVFQDLGSMLLAPITMQWVAAARAACLASFAILHIN